MINAENDPRQPLLHAILRNTMPRFEIFKLLLEVGADINTKDSNDITALEIAMRPPQNEDDYENRYHVSPLAKDMSLCRVPQIGLTKHK